MNSKWERRATKLSRKPQRIHGRGLLMTQEVINDRAKRARARRKKRYNDEN